MGGRDASGVLGHAGDVLDPATLSTEAWSAVTTQRQRTTKMWLQTEPLGALMLVRRCLEPMSVLLRGYITRSGDHFEQEQRAHDAHILTTESLLRSPRQTALLEFVALKDEKIFYQHLEQLRETHAWSCMPTNCMTVSFQGLGFRLLSKMGALVHEYLIVEANKYPLKLLRLLLEDGFADQVRRTRECLQDNFTKKFVNAFTLQGLDSDDAKACLHLLSMSTTPETVSIEWSHSRVHRVLTSLSQVQRPSVQYLNAQVVALQH